MDVLKTVFNHANELTGNEMKLLLTLYLKQEEAGITPGGYFSVGTMELTNFAGMTAPTMLKARQGLKDKGFITFIRTVKGTEYRIKDILNVKETLTFKDTLTTDTHKTNNPYEIDFTPPKIELY